MLKDTRLLQSQYEKGSSLNLDFCLFFLSHRRTIKPLKFKSALKLSFYFTSLDKKGGVRSDLRPFLFVFSEVHGIDLSTISNQDNSFSQWLPFTVADKGDPSPQCISLLLQLFWKKNNFSLYPSWFIEKRNTAFVVWENSRKHFSCSLEQVHFFYLKHH